MNQTGESFLLSPPTEPLSSSLLLLRQARFALYLVEALGAVLRANNVISAIDKEFFQKDANPLIIVDDDQHVAWDSITDAK